MIYSTCTWVNKQKNMANTKSAIRTIAPQERKRLKNLRRKRKLEYALHGFGTNPVAANVPVTTKAIDIAAKNGLIHKRKAARLKSQVSRRGA